MLTTTLVPSYTLLAFELRHLTVWHCANALQADESKGHDISSKYHALVFGVGLGLFLASQFSEFGVC